MNSKKYEYIDIFKKTCHSESGKGTCKKSHETKKCINDVCETVNPGNLTKYEILKDYKKSFKCSKCDYSSNTFKNFTTHAKSHVKRNQNNNFISCIGQCNQRGGCGPLCLAPILLI